MRVFTAWPKIFVPLILVGALVSGCDSGPASAPELSLLKDWSSIDALVVSDVSGKAVLSGIDFEAGRIDPLVVLPTVGDTRANRSAQVIAQGKDTFLVVLPGATPNIGLPYKISLATRRVTPGAAIPNALHLAQLNNVLVGLGSDNSDKYLLHQYDVDAKNSQPIPVPLKPSYSGVDQVNTSTCYGGGDGSHQRVGVFSLKVKTIVDASFAMQGNLTGVACRRGLVAAVVGDLPAAAGPVTAPVTIHRGSGRLKSIVVSATKGSSGQVAFQGKNLLLDVAASDGRQLLSVDSVTGKTGKPVNLPGVGGVECILPTSKGTLVVGTGASFIIRKAGEPAVRMTVLGDLYDMNIELSK